MGSSGSSWFNLSPVGLISLIPCVTTDKEVAIMSDDLQIRRYLGGIFVPQTCGHKECHQNSGKRCQDIPDERIFLNVMTSRLTRKIKILLIKYSRINYCVSSGVNINIHNWVHVI